MSPQFEEIAARFDDLTAGGEAFVLSEPVERFIAVVPAEVEGVLAAAEDAARRGRWVAGFVSYEAAAGLDPRLAVLSPYPDHPLADLPLAWFAVFDRREDAQPLITPASTPSTDWALAQDEDAHRAGVERIRAGIAAGDYYQVNLTTRLSGTVPDAYDRYVRLAVAQRGAYNAFLTTGTHAVVSASPELFFTRDGTLLTTRPMKGTSARGRWPTEDEARAAALKASPKERAENVMIVDLLRNDLGRVAQTGTVAVRSLLEVERYPTVWQLTSTVTARTSPGNDDLVTLFRALFPSGSVTGAPKSAAMQAIAEIEACPRGAYCGAIGYLAPDPVRPRLRFSVAIRTMTVALASEYAEYGAGGGITWASDPGAEWAELQTKTVVLRHPPAPPRSLLETMRLEPSGRVVNLERHLTRMATSARHFRFPCDVTALRSAIRRAGEASPGTCRLELRLDSDGIATAETEPLRPSIGVAALAFADRRVHSANESLFHQDADRRRYERLRRTRLDVDDVVLINEKGHVTETTRANLAVLLRGQWWTPPLDCGLLPGVERARLVESGVLAECVLTPADVVSADALALVSSLRGWRQARLVDDTRPRPVRYAGPSAAATVPLLPMI
ncbi:MAG: para-aminobenzoate synthetase / 4-amino-4-deoxychorismate lyase [Actinomycetota bacterium]|jgi:para-aminobenzoate synthetase/4-amino-4-deoxychorismate lyase|nr:para-aminobenzoate synthetase / 4-amino-4-deoxychorismate lyase [Actinomycetota bacterium]